jgi:LacI family transcriptional regulator
VELLINKGLDSDVPFERINNDDHIKAIIDRNIPFVMFDKISKLSKCSKIIDDQKAAFNAVQHLIDNGCKKSIPRSIKSSKCY